MCDHKISMLCHVFLSAWVGNLSSSSCQRKLFDANNHWRKLFPLNWSFFFLHLVRTLWIFSIMGTEFLTGWHVFPRPKFLLGGVFWCFVGIFVCYIAVPPHDCHAAVHTSQLRGTLSRLYRSDLYSYSHHNSSGLFFSTKLIIVRLSVSLTQRLYSTNKHNFEELVFKKNSYLCLLAGFESYIPVEIDFLYMPNYWWHS